MKITTFPVYLALILLAGFYSGSAVAAIQVGLAVSDGGQLVVTSNDSPCGGGESADCILVPSGSQPHMFFNLPNACSGNGPNYRLTAFRITEQNKVWPTLQTPLDTMVARDYCADPNSGYVELRNCQNQRKDDKLKIKNFNKIPSTVYYEITAENCTNPGDRIYLDPRIENKGTR